MLSSFKAYAGCFNPIHNTKQLFIRERYRLPFIDGLRALSMLYVVLAHAMVIFIIKWLRTEAVDNFVADLPWYLQWMLMGDKGVDAFFVISGFLIAGLLFKEHQRSQTLNLKRFYLRRWLRLTPAYWLFLILFGLFGVSAAKQPYLVSYAFYLNNFLEETNRVIPWLWSLAVEEQFYLVFPPLLLLLLKAKHRIFWLSAILVASLAIRLIILLHNPNLVVSGQELLLGTPELNHPYNQLLYINLHTRFGPFIMGILIAYVMSYHKAKFFEWLTPNRQKWIFSGLLLSGVGILLFPAYKAIDFPIWVYYAYHVCHRHIFALAICLTIVLLLSPDIWPAKAINRTLSSRGFFPFAQLSYSMYLFHLPVLLATWEVLKTLGYIDTISMSSILLLFGVALIPLSIICFLVFIFVEMPFMNMREVKNTPSETLKKKVECPSAA